MIKLICLILLLLFLKTDSSNLECYDCNDLSMDPPCTRPKETECKPPSVCVKGIFGENIIKVSYF